MKTVEEELLERLGAVTCYRCNKVVNRPYQVGHRPFCNPVCFTAYYYEEYGDQPVHNNIGQEMKWNTGLRGGTLVIHHMKNGRFKVKITGQPSNHLMDWNGCNYRIATVIGQPLRGFLSREKAEAFALGLFKNQKDVDEYALNRIGNGTFLKDEIVKDLIDVKF